MLVCIRWCSELYSNWKLKPKFGSQTSEHESQHQKHILLLIETNSSALTECSCKRAQSVLCYRLHNWLLQKVSWTNKYSVFHIFMSTVTPVDSWLNLMPEINPSLKGFEKILILTGKPQIIKTSRDTTEWLSIWNFPNSTFEHRHWNEIPNIRKWMSFRHLY